MKKKYCYLILFIVCAFLLSPFLLYLFPKGHDFIYHYQNIECLRNMFIHFNFSKISSYGIANDFGYGSIIFYPGLPHIITALISILFGTYNALKIVYFGVLYLSGIFMFKLLKRVFKRNETCLFGSLIYISTPYYINEVFIRCSLNEYFLILFMPMIFLGIFNINKNDFYFYLFFIFGYVGIINTHLVMGIYFTIFVIVFLLLNFKEFLSVKNIKKFIISSLFILLICSPFLILLIQHKMLGIYTVFESDVMGAYVDKVSSFGISAWVLSFPVANPLNQIFYFVYLISVFFFFKGIFNLILSNRKNLYGSIVVLIFISFLLSTSFFYTHFNVPDFLLNIQFPFRNLTFLSFFSCFIVAFGFDNFKIEKYRVVVYSLFFIGCMFTLYLSCNYKLISINVPTYNFNHLEMGSQHEYLTTNLNNNYDYFKTRSNSVYVLNNDTEINIYDNDIPSFKFDIKNELSQNLTLELPRLYYLGYDIKFIDVKGNKSNVNYNLSKNGFIEINNKTSGTYIITYKGTYLYRIFKFISLMFVLILVLFLYIKRVDNFSLFVLK